VEIFNLDKVREDFNLDITANFDKWHEERVSELCKYIETHPCLQNKYKSGTAIAAKLLNTFLHSLMRRKEYQHICRSLHLPLDHGVFDNLRKLLKQSEYRGCLKCIDKIIEENYKSPYSIDYETYSEIQLALEKLVKQINIKVGSEYELTSRIELNAILWD
jgi:hypothetical protein